MNKLYLFVLLTTCAFSRKMADISDAFKDMSCFEKQDVHFLAVRCFTSVGIPDPNCKASLMNAKKAKMISDIYMVPCIKCGNPAKQAEQAIKNAGGEKYEYIWVNVEGTQWNKDKNENRKFLTEIVHSITHLGKHPGIYTSATDWANIMGADWDAMIEHPLWYVHLDKVESFDDFKPFGGWEAPSVKQYMGHVPLCDGNVNMDYVQ